MDNPSYKELNEIIRIKKFQKKTLVKRRFQDKLYVDTNKRQRTYNKSQMNHIKDIDEITFKYFGHVKKWSSSYQGFDIDEISNKMWYLV